MKIFSYLIHIFRFSLDLLYRLNDNGIYLATHNILQLHKLPSVLSNFWEDQHHCSVLETKKKQKTKSETKIYVKKVKEKEK